MKFKVQRNILLKSLAFLICTCFLIVFILLLKKGLPSAVYYSVEKSNEENSVGTLTQTSIPDEYLYSDISKIQVDGPFTVKSTNEEIFVFYKDKKLYRIKTNLSSLPHADKEKIRSGIDVDSKSQLYETVYCLES